MTGIKRQKEWLVCHAHIFAAVLILIQPIMDVISFWFTELNLSNTPTLLMRFAVMAIATLWGFTIADSKKSWWILAAVLVFLYAGHAFACYQAGFSDLIGDLSNFIRTAQTPIFVFVFIACMKKNEKSFSFLLHAAAINMLVILGIEVLSVVTKTDPHTYSDGTGVLGWFFNTNSQSCILGMLTPFLMLITLRLKKIGTFLFLPVTFLCCGAMYLMGTRLAYACIFAVTLGFALVLLFTEKKAWFSIAGLVLIAVAFAAMYKISPMYSHRNAYAEVQQERQEATDAQLETEERPSEEGEDEEVVTEEMTKEEYLDKIETLTPIYERYVGDMVEIFGLEKTMKMYGFTSDAFEFSNVRQKKILFSEALMDTSPASARIFGLELSRFSVNGSIYDVENDFHGIYYLYGIAGLLAYLAFLIYFAILVVWALIKNAKRYFTTEAGTAGIALAICILHAYNTAGVLRRPNASVYLALALAIIYFLVKIRKEKTDQRQWSE